jgi:hypothetical protein
VALYGRLVFSEPQARQEWPGSAVKDPYQRRLSGLKEATLSD